MSGRFRRSGWNFRSRQRFARGRYSGRRVGLQRRARGNQRAANQQNDISNVTINMMKKVKTGVTARRFVIDGVNKDCEIGTCALNIFELLKKSDFYQSYSNMYDQFRINRIQVKVTPVTWRTYNQFNIPYKVIDPEQNNDNNNEGEGDMDEDMPLPDEEPSAKTIYPENYGAPKKNWGYDDSNYIVPQALTVVTAWDRTGLDDTQLVTEVINIPEAGNIPAHDITYCYTTIGDAISTYSSAKSTQLIAGATFNCVRYLYPSSQQEKSLYFSTTDLVEQIKQPTNGQPWYQMVAVDGNKFSTSKITNLHADPNCPFKPTFLIGILKVDDVQLANGHEGDPAYTKNQIYPVTFNLEFDIGVTFRGLRKTQIV